ncbi:GPI-GlcNAc transferase complex, PIG-H component-domain-containing protein [Tuber brumale]|nr:GPI-GlcNAc transferase complex, PIG-H component-domain-containing protein [Tuber brumale]
MFTANPKLRVRSPSPTTVEFTVTTAPRNVLTRQVVTWSTILLRMLVCSSAVLLVLLKYYPPQTFTLSAHVHAYVHPLLQYISTALATRISWRYLLPGVIVGLYIAIFIPGYTEESLLVIRDLGVQISTTTWGGRRSRFIPTSAVRDLWIHEGFCGFEVIFYLAVAVEGEEGVVVVFPTLLPNRRVLELVWRGAKGCLYEPRRVGR